MRPENAEIGNFRPYFYEILKSGLPKTTELVATDRFALKKPPNMTSNVTS